MAYSRTYTCDACAACPEAVVRIGRSASVNAASGIPGAKSPKNSVVSWASIIRRFALASAIDVIGGVTPRVIKARADALLTQMKRLMCVTH